MKKIKKRLLFLFLTQLCLFPLWAQNAPSTVVGYVYNQDKLPLAEVTVKVENTTLVAVFAGRCHRGTRPGGYRHE